MQIDGNYPCATSVNCLVGKPGLSYLLREVKMKEDTQTQVKMKTDSGEFQ